MWRQGQTHQHYTLSFLGMWGHGDGTLRYIPTETGTDTPPLYTLISGDVRTPGQFSRIYTYGDWDRHTTHIHSHFGDVGSRGQLPRIYRCGDRDIKYHPYTLLFLGTWGQYSRIYTYVNRGRPRRDVPVGVPLDLSTMEWHELPKYNGIQVSQLI